MVLDAEDGHEVEVAGHGVDLGDARHVGQGRTELGDGGTLGLDQHDRGDHEGDSLTSSADVKVLDTTNICSYNVFVTMGVGGGSTRRKWTPEALVAAMDEFIERADRDIESRRASRDRVLRARRNLELRMWRTLPLFCKPR